VRFAREKGPPDALRIKDERKKMKTGTMKKRMMMVMAVALAAGVVNAADVSATADFASAYVFRGVTLNDGLVFQPGAKISGFPIPQEYGSIAVGTWANYDIGDYGGALKKNEFSEIDYYVTYTLPVKVVDLSATYTEYTYPNGGANTDKEIAFSIGKGLGDTGLYTSLTANYGLSGAVDQNWYLQGALGYTKALTEALTLTSGLSVGYYIKDTAPDGFNDAVAKVGLSYALTKNWAINASLNYVAQLDDKVLPDTPAGEPLTSATYGYDTPVFGTLGLSCNF
jgi:opacity protein-like surface antigen